LQSARLVAAVAELGSLGGIARHEMTTTFSQTGGVRVGGGTFLAFNASWPFASLQADDSALTLSCLGKRWVFPKSSIRRLSKHSGLFSVGLRIEHSVAGYSEIIVFWTFRFAHLQRELEQRGYTVS
jgi:hypothetical protein